MEPVEVHEEHEFDCEHEAFPASHSEPDTVVDVPEGQDGVQVQLI